METCFYPRRTQRARNRGPYLLLRIEPPNALQQQASCDISFCLSSSVRFWPLCPWAKPQTVHVALTSIINSNIIFSVLLVKTYISHLNNPDPSLSLAVPSAWQESLVGYALISATIPCLKSFMKNFQTGGVGFTQRAYSAGTENLSGSRNVPPESHPLERLAASIHSRTNLRNESIETRSRISGSVAEDRSLDIFR